jgi:hypothetical protein
MIECVLVRETRHKASEDFFFEFYMWFAAGSRSESQYIILFYPRNVNSLSHKCDFFLEM